MTYITTLLIFLLSIMSGEPATSTCSAESWEDRSAVITCSAGSLVCQARVDAETQKIAAIECK